MSESPYAASLNNAGLNPNEVAVYLYLLEHGKTNVQRLLRDTGLKRGNLYHILYSLRDRNLVDQLLEAKKLHFQVKDPYFLRDLVASQREETERAALQLETILPSLASLFVRSTNKPSVRTYEGVRGIAQIYEELNASDTESLLLMRSTKDSNDAELAALVAAQIKKQVSKGIHSRVLTPLTVKVKSNFQDYDSRNLVERRLIQPDAFSLDAQILIWNQTVAMVSLENQIVGTVIENEAVAQSMRTIFEYLWGAAAEYHAAELARIMGAN